MFCLVFFRIKGLLHHLCNEHGWLGGNPNHDVDEHDETLLRFDQRNKDFQELQNIILNQELLDSFRYYTRFR